MTIEKCSSAVSFAVPANQFRKSLFQKGEESFLRARLKKENTTHQINSSGARGGLGYAADARAGIIDQRHDGAAKHDHADAFARELMDALQPQRGTWRIRLQLARKAFVRRCDRHEYVQYVALGNCFQQIDIARDIDRISS